MKALGTANLRLALVTAALVSAEARSKSKPNEKCDSILQKYLKQYHSHMADSSANRNLLQFDVAFGLLMTNEGDVTAEVFAATDEPGALLPLLASLDWVTVNGCYGRQCSARFHISQLEALTSHPEVVFVEANIISSNSMSMGGSTETWTSQSESAAGARALQSGSVDSFASQSMFADQARDTFGVDGTGVKICVLSDSFDFDFTTITSASDDVASGDLPSFSDMEIVRDLRPSDGAFGIDEGRAMMQLIHDIAPGATLGFHTAFLGAGAFANAIVTLIGRGCDVLVDDISYLTAPHYQDSVIAQAASSAANVGVAYFSSAGNAARNAWEGPYAPLTLNENPLGGQTYHDFGTSGGYLRVFLTQGTRISLHWSDPYSAIPGSLNGPETDLDIGLFEPGTFNFVEGSSQSNFATAFEFIIVGNTGPYDIYVSNFRGPDPDFVKLTFFGAVSVIDGPPLEAATSFGHSNAAGVVGVGAAELFDTPGFGTSPAIPEAFTAAGGVPILFNRAGERLEQPEVREAPLVVGPDGTCTTFFGTFTQGPGGNVCPFRFFGTSAAAPNVAAVAALMLEADPLLEPSDISIILAQTAEDMDDTFTPQFDVGYDVLTGYGFVNALNAVTSAVQTSTSPPSSAPSLDTTLTPSVAPSSPRVGKGKGMSKGMLESSGKGMMKEMSKGMMKEKGKGMMKEKSKGSSDGTGMDRYGKNGGKGSSMGGRNLGERKLVRGL